MYTTTAGDYSCGWPIFQASNPCLTLCATNISGTSLGHSWGHSHILTSSVPVKTHFGRFCFLYKICQTFNIQKWAFQNFLNTLNLQVWLQLLQRNSQTCFCTGFTMWVLQLFLNTRNRSSAWGWNCTASTQQAVRLSGWYSASCLKIKLLTKMTIQCWTPLLPHTLDHTAFFILITPIKTSETMMNPFGLQTLEWFILFCFFWARFIDPQLKSSGLQNWQEGPPIPG